MSTPAIDVLTPRPERGPQLAAGAVALTLAILVVDIRFSEVWADGVRAVIVGLAAALALMLAARGRGDGGAPPTWRSALLVAALVLFVDALSDVAQVLGASELSSSGTATWAGALFVAVALWLAARWDSAICTLLAGIAAVATWLAFVDWVFDPHGVSTFRWLTLVAIIALGAAAAATRTARPPHAVALVDAAGLAALLLAVLLAVDALIAVFGDGDGGGFDAAWGWELVLLVCGAALIAFAVRERERGPAYLGALVLLAFAAIAAPHDKASLIGWPIVLLIVAGALLAAALRPPPRPLPAEHEVTVRG